LTDALLVELNTNYGAHVDSKKALRSALEAALLPKIAGIDIIIFQGKDAGPTSLAAGVALRNAYGASDPLLATKVAAAILDPSLEISSLSPASSFPNSPFNRLSSIHHSIADALLADHTYTLSCCGYTMFF